MNLPKINRLRTEGAAIIYVVVVSVVIGLLLSLLLLLSAYRQKEFIQLQKKQQLILNVESGLNILRALEEPEYEKRIDLFGDGTDTVSLHKKAWGLFSVINATAAWKNFRADKTALLGQPADSSRVLYLADLNRPLSLAGSTRIEGRVFTPEAGIKRAYIEGVNFSGTRLIHGEIKNSGPHLPELDAESLEMTLQALEMAEELIPGSDTVMIPFNEPSRLMYADELENKTVVGNVFLYDEGHLRIPANCHLQDVIVMAESIVVERGFKGSIQLLAKDSIRIENGCSLKYPSSIVLLDSDRPGNRSVILGENCRVAGTIVVNGGRHHNHLPILEMHKGGELIGDAYVEGFTQLQGRIIGSLFTRKFYLKTASSIYENHILNGEIMINDKLTLPSGLRFAGNTQSGEIAKWLSY